MNPTEYLLTGFLIITIIGIWTLITAIRRAEDGFQNEMGFQLGTAPAVQLLDPQPAYYIPTAPSRAAVPESTPAKSRRRTTGTKPQMLPVNLEVADLNSRPHGKIRRARKTADSNPSIPAETQTAFPSVKGTPSMQ